jgi:hypothetical protein
MVNKSTSQLFDLGDLKLEQPERVSGWGDFLFEE